MIDVKTAVAAAHKYVESVQDFISVKNLGLEEVELSSDKESWLITLGYDRPIENFTSMVYGGTSQRVYKIFKISAESGEVESMKIREL
jgi:hypothetical protein